MRIIAITTAALLASLATASAQDVGGRYSATGTNLDGSSYKGTASITWSSRDTCRITWKSGDSPTEGICMRSGNVLTAAYSFSSGTVGLVIYEILPNGVLQGTWTVADETGVGTEILTPR